MCQNCLQHVNGGPGSENFGHEGRPGEVGGSSLVTKSITLSLTLRRKSWTRQATIDLWLKAERHAEADIQDAAMSFLANQRADVAKQLRRIENEKPGILADKHATDRIVNEVFDPRDWDEDLRATIGPAIARTIVRGYLSSRVVQAGRRRRFPPVWRKGGPGSGYFGHEGRPGEVGGSASESAGERPEGPSTEPVSEPRTESTPPSRLKNPKEITAWAEKHFGNWTNSLSDAEYDAFNKYSGGGYESIVNALRKGGPGKFQKTVDNLDKAIGRSKVPESVIVYRGLRAGKLSEDIKPGDIVEDKSYVSTSLHRAVGEKFAHAALMEITVPKGASGAAFDAVFEGGNRDEHELMLPRGSRFKIVGVGSSGGKTVIRAELLL